MQMANDNQATVAPVGVAWQRSRMTDSLVNLWSGDNSHPSARGTYLAACVFYASMWEKPVSGSTYYGTIGQQDAVFLQGIADLVVFDSLSQWRIGANKAQADFSWTVSNDTVVNFTSTASNATSHFWDFGDGSTDSSANPMHTFPGAGTYIVNYIVDNGCSQDTLSDTLTLTILVGLDDKVSENLQIYPNPAQMGQQLSLVKEKPSKSQSQIGVYNLQGRLLFQAEWPKGQSRFEVQLPDLPGGTYLLRLTGESELRTHRFQVID